MNFNTTARRAASALSVVAALGLGGCATQGPMGFAEAGAISTIAAFAGVAALPVTLGAMAISGVAAIAAQDVVIFSGSMNPEAVAQAVGATIQEKGFDTTTRDQKNGRFIGKFYGVMMEVQVGYTDDTKKGWVMKITHNSAEEKSAGVRMGAEEFRAAAAALAAEVGRKTGGSLSEKKAEAAPTAQPAQATASVATGGNAGNSAADSIKAAADKAKGFFGNLLK